MKLCGIYLITHIATGLQYVGQSIDIKKRMAEHSLGRANTKLGNAVIKYGWPAFSSEIIEICEPENLNTLEMQWVAHHNCVSPLGFNLTSGGSNQTKYSLETRQKMSEANRRRVVTEETKVKLRAKVNSPEARLAISLANKGRKQSEESCAKKSAASKRYNDHRIANNIPHPSAIKNLGRKRSAENNKKMLAIHLGSKRTAETCANISAAVKGKLKGRKQTPEHIANARAGLMGHKVSAETREKIAAKARGRKQSPEHVAKAEATRAANRLLRQNATVSTTGDLFA